MPSIKQYRYLHRGDNEWLADTEHNSDDEDWQEAWEELAKETKGIEVEFTEDMYSNDEYFDMPEWVTVTIKDEHILDLKMARGILKALPKANAITFGYVVDIEISNDFGGIGGVDLSVTAGGAYLTIREKHSSADMELYIGDQFNQAIGE